MFKKNNGKMYRVNAYYDVIDDFITIYNFLEMASNIEHVPVIYF